MPWVTDSVSPPPRVPTMRGPEGTLGTVGEGSEVGVPIWLALGVEVASTAGVEVEAGVATVPLAKVGAGSGKGVAVGSAPAQAIARTVKTTITERETQTFINAVLYPGEIIGLPTVTSLVVRFSRRGFR